MTLTETLRQVIAESGESLNQISKQAGIGYAMIHRFAHGSDVKLSTADKLAEYFGLELRPKQSRNSRRSK